MSDTHLGRTLPSRGERWQEVLGDTVFEFEGDRDNPAKRRVVGIRSLAPLAKKQKSARIPPAFHSALLSRWEDARANPGARQLVVDYIKRPSRSLYVHGAVGTGKTWAACCIGNELLTTGHAIRFQAVSGLLLALRDTFAAEASSELQLLAPLFVVQYLVLDELGDLALDGERHASAFASARLLLLLDRRWQEGRATIMTSNLSLAELVRWAGDERVGSRIRGVCGEDGVVELSGRDLRCDRPGWGEKVNCELAKGT